MILLSPSASALHLALRLALEARLRQRLGYQPQCLHHNDGILIRLTDTDEPILDLFAGLTPENVEGLILDELADSALLPCVSGRTRPGRCCCRAASRASARRCGCSACAAGTCSRSLAATRISPSSSRRSANACTIISTCRGCEQLLADIQAGEVAVVTRRAETPSPFAAGLLFAFTAGFMYQYDRVEAEPATAAALDRQLLEQLVVAGRQDHLLDPRAVHQVERRLRGLGQPPRSATEMAEWLRRLGDLTAGELEGPMAGVPRATASRGRAMRSRTARRAGAACARCWSPRRKPLYRQAFGLDAGAEPAQAQAAAADDLAPLPGDARPGRAGRRAGPLSLRAGLGAAAARGMGAHGAGGGGAARREARPCNGRRPGNLEQVQRGSLALSAPRGGHLPPPQFADFLLRWQDVHPETRRGGSEAWPRSWIACRACRCPRTCGSKTVLPARVPGYQPRWLDEWIAGGAGVWACQGDGRPGPGSWRFSDARMLRQTGRPGGPKRPPLDEEAARVLDACAAGALVRDRPGR